MALGVVNASSLSALCRTIVAKVSFRVGDGLLAVMVLSFGGCLVLAYKQVVVDMLKSV